MMIGRVLVPPMVTSDCQCAPVAPSTGDKEESASAGFNRGKWESRPRGSTHLPSTRGRSETPGSKEANVKERERRTSALFLTLYHHPWPSQPEPPSPTSHPRSNAKCNSAASPASKPPCTRARAPTPCVPANEPTSAKATPVVSSVEPS